jgi:NADP-dependent alcohol dehydrogenase
MLNFEYCNPTRIVFGADTIAQLSELVPTDVPILMTYGGGSIKRNGVYEQVVAALGDREVIEFGGIEPNPLYETCLKAIDVCREKNVGFLLAVGGGSVADATKFIAAGHCYEGDPWDLVSGTLAQKMTPIGVVLTLPATGSESNGNAVISRAATDEKLPMISPNTFPTFSILDPKTTFSLPANQVRNGIVDTFVHVMEQYLHDYMGAPLPDRFAEGILQTLIEVAPKTLANMEDYEARADFMWCATLALNTLIACGTKQDWATHMIGHEVTAFYGPAHAETLAIMLPGVWELQMDLKRPKLEQMGKRVFGVDSAEATIAAVEEFFHSIGMPTHLSDYNIDANEAAQKVADRFTERGTVLGENQQLTPAHVAEIIRSRA